MRTRRLSALTILLAVVVTTLAAGPVAAAPLDKQRDRSDNTMYFQYNPVTGRIDTAFSSRLVRRGDRIDFLVYAQERRTSEVGERLRARINLGLNRDRAVSFDGVLTVVIQDDTGARAFRGTRSVDFVLRPREGMRRRHFRWIFDLDKSGYYTITAKFRAD